MPGLRNRRSAAKDCQIVFQEHIMTSPESSSISWEEIVSRSTRRVAKTWPGIFRISNCKRTSSFVTDRWFILRGYGTRPVYTHILLFCATDLRWLYIETTYFGKERNYGNINKHRLNTVPVSHCQQ